MMSALGSDPVLTFKFKMAAVDSLENYFFRGSIDIADLYCVPGDLDITEFLNGTSFTLQPSFDHEIQDGRYGSHLEKLPFQWFG